MSKYKIKEPMPQYGANTARIINVPDEVVKQIRTDAIDEFVTIIKERVGMDWEWDFYFIGQIAEELKEQK